MNVVLDQECRRVAVVRLLPGLGEMLCVVPALRGLRAALPAASITVVGLPNGGWFAERFPDLVDEWLDVPYWPGLADAAGDPNDTLRVIGSAREAGFDAAIQLHGTGSHVNDLTFALGARLTAGFHAAEEVSPGPAFYPWPESGHESHRLSRLVHALGCPWPGDEITFRERPEDIAEALPWLDRVCGRPFAVVHPGAASDGQRWSVEGFARVAAGLAGRGLGIVVTGGEHDRALAAEITRLCPHAVNCVGVASHGALAVMMRRADLALVNASDAAHIAAATGTSSVVVFASSDPERWASLDHGRHCVVDLRPFADDDLLHQLRAVDQAVSAVLGS